MNINLSLQPLRMNTRGPPGTILPTSLMMVVIVFKFISMDAICMLHKSFESLYYEKTAMCTNHSRFYSKGINGAESMRQICCIHESESAKLEFRQHL